jgi:uridine kinase
MTQSPAALVVEPLPVILVEGLFVLAEPFASLLDMAFFLDVADDQRLLGRILRDVIERDAAIEEIVDRYQRFVRPSYQVFVEPTKYNANVVVDFTYRRALFGALLTHIVRDYVAGVLDLGDFLRHIGPERFGLGFDVNESFMPVSVDIRELAKAYPESVRPLMPPSPLEEAATPA